MALPVGAQDTPGVLDEPSFPSDWGGEEQGVEDWAVEAFPGDKRRVRVTRRLS